MRLIDRFEFDTFEWDENRRRLSREKSGIDFPDAARSLLEPHLEFPSPKHGEARTKAIRKSDSRIMVVIFTHRGTACRIISAWPADKNEQRTCSAVFGG